MGGGRRAQGGGGCIDRAALQGFIPSLPTTPTGCLLEPPLDRELEEYPRRYFLSLLSFSPFLSLLFPPLHISLSLCIALPLSSASVALFCFTPQPRRSRRCFVFSQSLHISLPVFSPAIPDSVRRDYPPRGEGREREREEERAGARAGSGEGVYRGAARSGAGEQAFG